MFLKPKTIIGMQITPAWAKMVEMSASARPARIINYAEVDLNLLSEEKAADRIRETLDRQGFTTRKVNVALSGSILDHRTIILPFMSKADMRMVLKREIKKESKIPVSDLSFDTWITGEVEERGVKKRELLAVTVLRREVDAVIKLVKESGLDPQVLTTSSLALLNGLGMLEQRQREKVVSFIFLGVKNCIITVLEDGKLRFSRVFSVGLTKSGEMEGDGTVSPEEGNDILSRLITEVNRSFFYYKQHFRGRPPDRIILGGNIDERNKIKIALEGELGMEVAAFNPGDNLDCSSLQEKSEEFLKLLPYYSISLGAGFRGLKDIDINFLPLSMQQRKQLIAKQVTVGIAAGIASILVVGGYIGLSGSLDYYQETLFRKKNIWGSLQGETEALLRAKENRVLHQERIFLLGGDLWKSSLWKGRLKALSLLVPDEMIFEFFLAKKEGERLTVTIKGRVIADNAAHSQAVFNRFYRQLKDSVLVQSMGAPEVKLKPFRKNEKEANPSRKAKDGEKMMLSEVSFEIDCRFWSDYY